MDKSEQDQLKKEAATKAAMMVELGSWSKKCINHNYEYD